MKVLKLCLTAPLLTEAQKQDKGPTRGPRGRGRKLEELKALYQSQIIDSQAKKNQSKIFERTGDLDEDDQKSRALSFAFLEQFSKVDGVLFFIPELFYSTKFGESPPATPTTTCSSRSMTTVIWSSSSSTTIWLLLKTLPTTSSPIMISFLNMAAIATCLIRRSPKDREIPSTKLTKLVELGEDVRIVEFKIGIYVSFLLSSVSFFINFKSENWTLKARESTMSTASPCTHHTSSFLTTTQTCTTAIGMQKANAQGTGSS